MGRGYKDAKEAFVSNLTGGTIWEINKVTLVAPVSIRPLIANQSTLILKMLQAAVLLWSALQSRRALFIDRTPITLLIDFLLNCCMVLFATTIYSSAPLRLDVLLIAPALLLCFAPNAGSSRSGRSPGPRKSGRRSSNASASSAELAVDPFPVKPFVTAYRGTMMVITCIAILAVDFPIFPRRFAKVENWGTSLMDLGVGSFVFSAGVVSARYVLKQRLQGLDLGLLDQLRSSFRHSSPLVVLGLVRLYSVKGLDYAEHVTEYGVHWNFFFTLSLLPPFVALLQPALGFLRSRAGLAIVLATAYELVLNFTELKAYVLTAPRLDLLSKNREGVFSFVGYLAIFLSGQAMGVKVLPRRPKTLQTLLTWSAIWSTLFFLSTDFSYGLNLLVSRRLANLPYFLWVAAFNCCQLASFCAVEELMFPQTYHDRDEKAEKQRACQSTSAVLQAFNRNGLAIFLLANLLTGLINLTLPTLEMQDTSSMAVLVFYMGILTVVALLLDRYNISIKL